MIAFLQPLYRRALFLALASTTLLTACNQEDYLRYDTKQQDALILDYTTATGTPLDSVNYVFGFDPSETHEIRVPLRLVGAPKAEPRAYALEIIDSLTTMREGVNYEFDQDSLRINADAVAGVIKLRLLRSKDPELQEQEKRLVFTIKDNGTFRSFHEQRFTVVYSDIRPNSAPRWWDRYTLPPYRFELAQRLLYHFYQTQQSHPDIFNARIARFGEYFMNFDNVRRRVGEVFFDNFMLRYAVLPLYEETKDNADITWPRKPAIY